MRKKRGKIGRPKLPAEEVRDNRLEVRLSDRELTLLTRAADKELSTWVREVALQAAREGNG